MGIKIIIGMVLLVFTLVAGGCATYGTYGYGYSYPYGSYDDDYYYYPYGPRYYDYWPPFFLGFLGGDFEHHGFRRGGERFERRANLGAGSFHQGELERSAGNRTIGNLPR